MIRRKPDLSPEMNAALDALDEARRDFKRTWGSLALYNKAAPVSDFVKLSYFRSVFASLHLFLVTLCGARLYMRPVTVIKPKTIEIHFYVEADRGLKTES